MADTAGERINVHERESFIEGVGNEGYKMQERNGENKNEKGTGKSEGIRRSGDDPEDVRGLGEEMVDYPLPEIKEFGPEDLVP